MSTASTTVTDKPSITTTQPIWSPNTIMQILFVNFGLFFQSTCIVFTQLFSLLLYPFSYKLYRQFISYTMRMWSQNLIALVELFAPSEYVLTFDKSCGPVQDILQSDDSNHITGLHLPERMIVIANHQVKKKSIPPVCRKGY